MKLKDLFTEKKTAFSFEFFPPKTTEGIDTLFQNIAQLAELKPSYVSVTYGAGGSTKDRTRDLVIKIKQKTDLTVVSHLTCTGSSKTEIESILTGYAENGIENILALRGDPPLAFSSSQNISNDFRYASDLVTFIKKKFPTICVGVAGFPEGHPETPNRLKEIEYLKRKVDCGADYIITQLFFDNRDFNDFRERCELAGINIPIIAGIMPLNTKEGMVRLADLAAGSRIPAPLLRAIARVDNSGNLENIGAHWAAEQVRDLLDHNVRGIHLYTLNDSVAVKKIYRALGVENSTQLQP